MPNQKPTPNQKPITNPELVEALRGPEAAKTVNDRIFYHR